MRKLNLFYLISVSIFMVLGYAKAQVGSLVTEEGMAEIINGDVQAATAAAERVALCKAVGRKIGIEVDSIRVTDDAEALINIIRTHITGHAKILETIEKWTDKDNYRHVKIQAYVSPKITEEEMKKLEPATLFLLLDTEVKNEARQKINIDSQKQMKAKMGEMLTGEGYQITPLPDALANKLKELLNNRTPTGIDNWYLSELAGAAGIFVVGEVSILLRVADTPGFQSTMYAAEFDTDLKIMQNNESIAGLNTILYEKTLSERGIHKRIKQAVEYAIDDTVKSIKKSTEPNFLDKLEEHTGPPNRLVYLYVIGFRFFYEYNDLQDYLRQKLSPLGVEDVRGVRFDARNIGGKDWNASKIILEFSNQIEDKFSDVVNQISLTIDQNTDYNLLKKVSRTIIIERNKK